MNENETTVSNVITEPDPRGYLGKPPIGKIKRALITDPRELVKVTELVNKGDFIDEYVKIVQGLTNIETCVTSIYLYPFNVASHSVGPSTLLSFFDTTTQFDWATGQPLTTNFRALVKGGVLTVVPRTDDFRDYQAIVDFYVPYVGWVNVDTRLVMGKECILIYAVDLDTGVAHTFITARTPGSISPVTTDERIVWTGECQLGTRYDIVPYRLNNTAAENMIEYGGKTAKSIGMTALNLVAGNWGGAAIGLGKTVMNAATLEIASNMPAVVATNQMMTGNAGNYVGNENNNKWCKLHARVLWVNGDDYEASGYEKYVGKPYYESARLGDMTGFTVVGEHFTASILGATEEEVEEINNLLHSGVIL